MLHRQAGRGDFARGLGVRQTVAALKCGGDLEMLAACRRDLDDGAPAFHRGWRAEHEVAAKRGAERENHRLIGERVSAGIRQRGAGEDTAIVTRLERIDFT